MLMNIDLRTFGETGFKNQTGGARVFAFNKSTWEEFGRPVEGEANGDRFGYAVALSSTGLSLACGAPFSDANETLRSDRDRVCVFGFHREVWNQIVENMDGVEVDDGFGASISLSTTGERMAVGAPVDNRVADGVASGVVRVFEQESLGYNKFTPLLFVPKTPEKRYTLRRAELGWERYLETKLKRVPVINLS